MFLQIQLTLRVPTRLMRRKNQIIDMGVVFDRRTFAIIFNVLVFFVLECSCLVLDCKLFLVHARNVTASEGLARSLHPVPTYQHFLKRVSKCCKWTLPSMF